MAGRNQSIDRYATYLTNRVDIELEMKYWKIGKALLLIEEVYIKVQRHGLPWPYHD